MKNAREMVEVARLLDGALTVGELLSLLKDMDENALVLFSCDYGDYSHTMQALPARVVEQNTLQCLHKSAYSKSGVAVDDPDDEDEGEEPGDAMDADEFHPVVLIS